MAILANRSYVTRYWIDLSKFLLDIFRKSIGFFLLLLSIQLLYFVPHKKVSNITLEITGNLVSSTISIYETVFKQVAALKHALIYFKDLEAENIALKLEVARLQKLQSLNHATQIENAELKKLLPLVEDRKFDYIATRLLSVSINSFNQTALIGAGKNHGITVDQIVASSDGLIGRIIEVSDNYSKVMLLKDFNSSVPVITSMSRERGILVGNGHGLNMVYLQDDHAIGVGEKLVTSGDGDIYPPGIEVAQVTSISKDRVTAKPIANYSGTDFVIVYSNNQ